MIVRRGPCPAGLVLSRSASAIGEPKFMSRLTVSDRPKAFCFLRVACYQIAGGMTQSNVNVMQSSVKG